MSATFSAAKKTDVMNWLLVSKSTYTSTQDTALLSTCFTIHVTEKHKRHVLGDKNL